MKYTLGVIGAGNMAYAIVKGVLEKEVLPAHSLIISDINEAALARFSALDKDIKTTTENREVFENASRVLFAIKPQTFHSQKNNFNITSNLVLSIMAGVSVKTLQAVAPHSEIVRVMPNTPAQLGCGVSALTSKNEFAERIFSAVGEVIILPETDFDAVTAVSGSGPAYVYYFMREMKNAAVKLGLGADISEKLVLSTFKGAVKLAEGAGLDFDKLISAVKSPKGTTEAALNSFDKNKLGLVIEKGAAAAAARSKELSEGK